MNLTNQEVADLLRSVATAITLKGGNQFQTRAYENAADSIEHSTSNVQDLWAEGKLDEIPGLGERLQEHLTELFKTGQVKHFESLMKHYPEAVYELIKIPGVGPKTAVELASLGVKSTKNLLEKIKSGELVKQGFSGKLTQRIAQGIQELHGREGRMLLPFATAQAEKILTYLKKGPGVTQADPLGSLRRQVATIGDLDFAAAANDPKKAVDYFTKMPGVKEVVNKGENKGTLVLNSGLHVDLLVGQPDSYGALLQHFTGGKNHNIKLRTYALKKGLSLNEDGVKTLKTGKLVPTKTEKEFYELLKMATPAPEIREDTGEIEAALANKLPNLVQLKDIKGDLHLHSNFPIEHPSHGPGVDSLEEIIKKAIELGYEYVGISDHPPAFRTETKEGAIRWVEKRTKAIEQLKSSCKSKIRVLNGLEIDILPDGTLSVPNQALETLDYCLAGIHSGHKGSSEDITKRIMTALASPLVDIISHPTGRLLNERSSYEADWDEIFEYCGKNHKLLEINSFPNRLDLRDDLVRATLKFGVKFVIDTDAHEVSQMHNMRFGVAVARRGWVEAKDVVNSWDWKKFTEWFNI